MDAVILVGGQGIRLRSVVSDKPKPMAEVAGRPLLEWLLIALRAQKFQRVILATGHKSEFVEEYFESGERLGIEILYSRDPFPLGTGGGIRHALQYVTSDRFLAMNGDSYCRFDVPRLSSQHEKYDAKATLWLVRMDDCSRYGSVEVSNAGEITAFREKSPETRSGVINAGVYLFEKKVVEEIPENRRLSIEREFFPRLVGNGLYAVIGDEPFIDIGTPESYREAEKVLHNDLKRLAQL